MDEGSVSGTISCPGCRPGSHKAHTPNCPRSSKKRKSGDENPEDGDKNKDIMDYEITETSYVPLGTGFGVVDSVRVMLMGRRPWFYREGVNKDGPWNRSYTTRLFENERLQRMLATSFGRPLSDSGCVREHFSHDVVDKPITSLRDSVAEVVNTMLATNSPSELDKSNGEAACTWMPGYNRNRITDVMHFGPEEGGLDGRHELLLFKLHTDESSGCTNMMMDSDIAAIATQLCQAKHANDLPPGPMFFSMPCSFSKPKQMLGRKAHDRTIFKPAIAKKMPFTPSDSVNEDLLHTVAKQRLEDLGVEDLPGGIDDKDIMRGICQAPRANEEDLFVLHENGDENNERETITSNLFQVFLWTDVIAGIDDKGNARRIRMDAVLLRMSTPGADGGLLLDCMRQNVPCFVEPLMRTLSHMSLVLGMRSEMNTQDLFDTPTGAMQQHIVSLTEPGQLLLAIFLFAYKTGTHNVQWQGMRIDASSEEEVRLYRAHLQETIYARARHYSIIKAACDVWGTTGKRPKEVPMMAQFGMRGSELFDGYHYVFEEEGVLDDLIGKVYEQASDATERHQWQMEYAAFRERCVVTEEQVGGVMRRHVYWPEAGNIPYKSGIFVLLNPDLVQRFDFTVHRTNKNGITYRPILDIYRMSPMLEIWMKRAIEGGKNALGMFFRGEYVCDRQWLTTNEAKLAPEVRELFEYLRKELLFAKNSKRLTEDAIYTDQVLKLYGARTHAMRRMLHDVMRSTEVVGLAGVMYNTIHYNTAEALTAMENGPLAQMRAAAMSMRGDMRQQGETNAEMFLRSWNIMQDKMIPKCSQRGELGGLELAHDGARYAFFRQFHKKNLAYDLSFQNELLADIIADSTIAMMTFMSKVWGAPVKVSDGAMANTVLRKTNHGRTPVQWDLKSPGCGVDCLVNFIGGENLAFGCHISRNRELAAFYASKENRDVTGGRVTGFAQAKFLGCGIMMTPEGVIDRKTDCTFERQFGLVGHLTEGRKINANSASSEDEAANLECFIGDSGTGKNIQKQGWVTTTQFATSNITQMMLGGSVCIVCNNRIQPAFPSSSLEGGRYSFVHSSVMDREVGIMFINRERRMHAASANSAARSMTLETLQADDRGKIKEVDEAITETFVVHFLWRHLCRKGIPFVLRVLTTEVVREDYVHALNARRLSNSWRMLTRGVRREFMQEDNIANRTLNGPWECATLVPEWIKRVTFSVMMRALETPKERAGRDRSIDLSSLVENCVTCVQLSPVDVYAYLNSMFIFTSQKALDMNIMIVSCYQLALLGFHQHCPLEVIALVMRGEVLSPAQRRQYQGLCQFIKDVLTPTQNSKRGLVHCGWVQAHNKATVQEWAHYHQPENVHIVQQAHEELNGLPSQMLTCYVRPNVEFVMRDTPEWLQKPANGRPAKSDARKNDFAMSTTGSMVAELWAEQQTVEECRKRQRAAAANDQPLKQYECVSSVWRSAIAGTRLPSEQTQGKSNDKHHFSFDSQNTSGFYFQQVLENSEQMQGLYLHILQLCDLTRETSRAEFMRKLFEKFEGEKPDFSSEDYDNEYWNAGIGIPDDNVAPFRWGIMPHATRNSSHFEVVDGVETLLGTDLFWLIVAQALFCQEWHPLIQSGACMARGDRRTGPRGSRNQNVSVSAAGGDSSNTWQAVIHLRNLSSAAEVLMMLLLHLHVEKAAIPAAINTGAQMRIILNHPCADLTMRDNNASIVYDPRLHLDSYDSDLRYDPRHVLCMRARGKDSFSVVFLQDCGRVHLYYKAILREQETSWRPHVIGDIQIFPPESYYHMHTHLRLIRHATKLLLEKESLLRVMPGTACVLAHQMFGVSATTVSMRFVPCALTQAAVEDEIPCLSLHHAFMFTLVPAGGGKFRVQPTEPTHAIHFGNEISASLAREYGLDELCALPLTGERLCCASKIGVLANQGLVYDKDKNNVRINVGAQGAVYEEHNRVPFTFWPISPWSHLLFLTHTHECRVDLDGRKWRVVDAEDELIACSALQLSAKAVEFWRSSVATDVTLCCDNIRILAPDTVLRDAFEQGVENYEMQPTEMPDDMFVFCVQYEGFLWWFNNRAALRAALQRNGGVPCSEKEVRTRALEGNFVVDDVYVSDRIRAPTLYPVFEDTMDRFSVPMANFDDQEYERLTRKAHGLMEKVKHSRIMLKEREAELRIVESRLGMDNVHGFQTPTRTFVLPAAVSSDTRSSADDERERTALASSIKQLRDRIAVQEREGSLLQASIEECRIDRRSMTTVQFDVNAEVQRGLAPLRAATAPVSDMTDDDWVPPVAALTVPWDDGKWLRRGRYRVQYSDGAGLREMPMDFISHSLGIIPEGTPLFVRVGASLYNNIKAQLPLLFVNDADLHDMLMDDDSSDAEFYLQVFYVLGARAQVGVSTSAVKVRTLIGTTSDDCEQDNLDAWKLEDFEFELYEQIETSDGVSRTVSCIVPMPPSGARVFRTLSFSNELADE